MIRTQILVIGAGPAGSTAARFLAKAGIETLLVERNLSFIKPCGGGVPSTVFDDFGIPENTVKRYVDTIRIVSPGGNNVNIRLEGGSIAIVERGDFDSALRHEAYKCGANILSAEFRRFAEIDKTIVAELISDGQNISVSADYVIAADGVNSRVRAAMNIRPVASFITVSEKIKGTATDFCEFWFGSSHAPRLYSWVFPQKDGVSAGTGSIDGRGIKILWQRFVERRGLKTGMDYSSEKSGTSLRGYKIPLWQGDLYNKGRILFAGDAAGQVLPLTYEGIYYAMKSGELAATAIINGNPKTYKKLWEIKFQRRFSIMKRLWKYFLKNDRNAERFVQLHERPEIQEASMRLWLRKDLRKESIISYMSGFSKFLK